MLRNKRYLNIFSLPKFALIKIDDVWFEHFYYESKGLMMDFTDAFIS